MKVANKIDNLQFVGMVDPVEFSIHNSPAMMQILSDNIYQDSISAIIRETATNSYDAHVEAGTTDIPFDIHLPTIFEPYYSIRDYGIGLSKEDMTRIYTTYGMSNELKTSSNDYVGFMGIGSKSPFSYTSNFNVTSYFNGKKIGYFCSKNERNIPTLFLLSEEDTELPNGLEVTFEVKSSDFYNFKVKAIEVFNWFKVKPNVNGNLDYPVPLPTQFEIDGLKVSFQEYDQRKEYVVCGQVKYDLNFAKLESSELIKNFAKHGFYGFKFQFELAVGEFDVDAARENVRYTNKTIKALEKKFELLKEKILEYYNSVLATTFGKWETNTKLNSSPAFIQRCLEIFFKNQKLFVNKVEIPTNINLGKILVRRRSGNKYLSWGSDRNHDYTRWVPCSENTLFIILDIKRGYPRNILNFNKIDEFASMKHFVILQSDELGNLNTFIEEWGLVAGKNYVIYSDYKDKFKDLFPRQKRDQIKELIINCYKLSRLKDFFHPKDHYSSYDEVLLEEALEDETCYYIPVNKRSLAGIYENKNNDFIKLIPILRYSGLLKESEPIYTLNSSTIKKIQKIEDNNFVNLFEFIKDNIEVIREYLFSEKEKIGPAFDPDMISKYREYNISSLSELAKMIKNKGIKIDDKFFEYLEKMREVSVSKEDIKFNMTPVCLSLLNFGFIDKDVYDDIIRPIPAKVSTVFEDFLEDYPIFKLSACFSLWNISYNDKLMTEFAKYLTTTKE